MKERDDFEPSNSNSDLEPVASHSVEDNNAIEQEFDGYHKGDVLDRVKNWDAMDVFNLIEFVCCKWEYQNWGVKKHWETKDGYEVLKLELHTAGWSGNEDLINSLLENRMFTMMWYESWRQGGHYYFEINPFNVGFIPVSQFCKKIGLTKQAIHKNKDKYDWLNCGNKKLLVRERKFTPLSNSDKNVQVSDTTEVKSMGEPMAQNNTPVKEDWISVEDRLPDCVKQNVIIECSEEVQIFDSIQGINQAWLKRFLVDRIDPLFPEYKKGYWLFENTNSKYNNVTHWRPLPAPPTNLISKPLK